MSLKIPDTFRIGGDLTTAILALNNAHATELSLLDAEALEGLVSHAFYARQI